MESNFSKITNAISKSKKIHIYYRKVNELHCSIINPLGLIAYKKAGEYEKQLYVVAMDDNVKKMYLLKNIEDVEVKEIGFVPKEYTLQEMLEGSKFILKNATKIPRDVQDEAQLRALVGSQLVVPDQIREYGKLYKLLDYYSKCLYKESMQSLEIIKGNKDYFFPSIENYAHFLNGSMTRKIGLDSHFTHIYKEWMKKLRENPELKIYMGYPIIEYRDKYIPLMFYPIEYNEEMNFIEYNGAVPIINSQFLNTELELLEDEISKIKSDILAQQLSKESMAKVFNKELMESIDRNIIDFKGIMFQHENLVEQTAIIKDLRIFKNQKEEMVSAPLKRLIGAKVLGHPNKSNDKLNNIVISNQSQEKAAKNVFNDTITVIQGPPGTGKTQTILNIISNCVATQSNVLISSYNNKAVDNIVDKLKKKEKLFPFVLRVGNQEMRKEAVKSIRGIIDWTVQEISQSEIDTLELAVDELRNSIHSIEEQLDHIEKLEAKNRCLKESIEEKKLSLDKVGFSDQSEIDELLNENINKVGKTIINELNDILVRLQIMETKRLKWYNRLLLKMNYPYEEKCCGKIGESLSNSLKAVSGLKNNKSLQEMQFAIAMIILYISYKLLVDEQTHVEQELAQLDKKGLICMKDKAVKQQIDKTKALLYNKHINHIIKISNEEKSELRSLLDQYEENIFTRSEEGFEIITKYFPVWVTTNLGAPSSIPSTYRFQVGVIDEASQSTIPSAIPIIARSERMVIVGDDKQLSPIVKTSIEEDEALLKECLSGDENLRYLYSKKSLFDLYKSINGEGKTILLDEHYRCDAQIIQFSNKYFYNNQLKVMTTHEVSQGIVLKDVKGITESGAGGKSAYNTAEINKIKELLCHPSIMNANKSIGIITPFRKQKLRLEQMLNELLKNKEIASTYKDNITIGTVHTFQGDEKDIIIYSCVISEGSKNTTVQWLNRMDNLFNVAITRARETFILVGNLDYVKSSNGILNKLINYISRHTEKVKEALIINSFEGYKSTGVYGENENGNTLKLLNPGERKLYEKIIYLFKETEGYMIVPKVRVADVINLNRLDLDYTEFRYGLSAHFDFVIFNQDTLVPIKAIELDGKYHVTDPKTQQNDKIKNKLCMLSQFQLVRVLPQETKDISTLKEKLLN